MKRKKGTVTVDTAFEGGNIKLRSIDESESQVAIELELGSDNAAEFRQWFAFRVLGAAGKRVHCTLVDVDEAQYPAGFEDYSVCVTEVDDDAWIRIPTEFRDTEETSTLEFWVEPETQSITFAYFAMYTRERAEELLADARAHDDVEVIELARSTKDRPVSAIYLPCTSEEEDEDEQVPTLWVIGRQHPGEVMAEWYMEGIARRLLDPEDESTELLRSKVSVYLVPCMNPDGAVLGNHRTNGRGVDLNRAWEEPDPVEAPEVAGVRKAILATRTVCFLDVHGDERHPWVFAAGNEGNPGYTDEIESMETAFLEALCACDAEFQRAFGYERDAPGEGDLRAAANWVGEHFGCLALTLEMPFKDAANRPDPVIGWSPERAMGFGQNTVDALAQSLEDWLED